MSDVNDFDLQAGEGVGLAVRVHPAKDDAVGTRGDFSDFGESGGSEERSAANKPAWLSKPV